MNILKMNLKIKVLVTQDPRAENYVPVIYGGNKCGVDFWLVPLDCKDELDELDIKYEVFTLA